MDDSAEVAAGKQRLRVALLAARRERSAAALDLARRAVADAVVVAADAAGWSRVAAYEPMRTEPGSAELLGRLVAAGIEVIVPITLPDRDLDWRRWPSGPLSGGAALGLDAVSHVDAVLVPALAVGRDGSRLGRGGGSYDRALRRRSPGTSRLALVFDEELRDTVPTAPWDVAVDVAITPSGPIRLAGASSGNTAVAPGD